MQKLPASRQKKTKTHSSEKHWVRQWKHCFVLHTSNEAMPRARAKLVRNNNGRVVIWIFFYIPHILRDNVFKLWQTYSVFLILQHTIKHGFMLQQSACSSWTLKRKRERVVASEKRGEREQANVFFRERATKHISESRSEWNIESRVIVFRFTTLQRQDDYMSLLAVDCYFIVMSTRPEPFKL